MIRTVEELQEEWMDPYAQWYAAGMPSFLTGDLSPFKQITINFKTLEDRAAFAELFDYKLTEKTRVVYFPNKENKKNIENRIVEIFNV